MAVVQRVVTRRLAVAGAASSLTRLTQSPTDETEPTLAPNGNALMFVASTRVNGRLTSAVLASIDPSTGARRTIFTPERAISVSPEYLPTGESLIYVSNRSGPAALVRSLSASPNSGVAILMDENQASRIGSPSISPDGTRIAAHAIIAGTPSIVTVDIGRTGQYSVLAEGESPSFSPDGQRIAFARRVGDTLQVFTMRSSDGTDLVQVSQGAYSAAYPEYSPDGRWLIYASNRSSESNVPATDGRLNLFAISLDGSNLTQVTDGDARNSHPDWGRDGWIYFESNQGGNFDIWRLRPEGALAQPATPPPSVMGADGGALPTMPVVGAPGGR